MVSTVPRVEEKRLDYWIIGTVPRAEEKRLEYWIIVCMRANGRTAHEAGGHGAYDKDNQFPGDTREQSIKEGLSTN